MMFHRDVEVPIWHRDTLLTPVGTVDIGLIRDEANVAATRRGPRVELHPVSENSAATIELAQGADPSTSEPSDTIPDESTHGTSSEPSLLHHL